MPRLRLMRTRLAPVIAILAGFHDRHSAGRAIGNDVVPADPDSVSSFMNIRVADSQACYELWRSRGAKSIAVPKVKYGETRCYIRDPDGYIIEVGQSKPGIAYG